MNHKATFSNPMTDVNEKIHMPSKIFELLHRGGFSDVHPLGLLTFKLMLGRHSGSLARNFTHSLHRDKFQKRVTCVTFSIEFAKTN